MNLDEFTDKTIGKRGTPRRSYFERHMNIARRTDRYLNFVFGWLKRIPILGELAFVWWTSLLAHRMEGYVAIDLDNAIDALIFSFLNDGMRPSLWHTWQQLIRDDSHEFAAIWPGRAPRNRGEA